MLLTIGPGGCGFTFLNWSISYLRGDTSYCTLNGICKPILQNPIIDKTAHKFNKDHLRIEDSIDQLTYATKHSIIYAVPGHQQHFEQLIKLPGKKIIFDTTNYSRMLMARSIVCMPKNSSYNQLIDLLSSKFEVKLVQEVLIDCHKLFIQYYKLTADTEHFYKIDYNGMFNLLDEKIIEIFNYLEIEIDSNRLEHWKNVYKDYQIENCYDFQTDLVSTPCKNYSQKTQILKEILKWKHGLYQTI